MFVTDTITARNRSVTRYRRLQRSVSFQFLFNQMSRSEHCLHHLLPLNAPVLIIYVKDY